MEELSSTDKKENIVITDKEYTSLQNEIISIHQRKDGYEIACYTITITLFGFALQLKNEWLFLLPYLILFPIQRIISNKQAQATIISAYLAVFSDDTWEKYYTELHEGLYKNDSIITKISRLKIMRVSTLYLSMLSTLFCITINIYNYWFLNGRFPFLKDISMDRFLPSVVSIFLFVMMGKYTLDALKSGERREDYIKKFNAKKLKMEGNVNP